VHGSDTSTSLAPSGSSPPDSTSAAATPVSATTPATDPAGATACALVTEQDVTTELGADPGPGSKFNSHGSSQCQYGSYQTRFVLVNLIPAQARAGYDTVRNNRNRPATVHVVDVAGVGDRAFEVSGPHTAGIYFNKGDALIVVTVEILTITAPPTGQTLALAKTAASRV
jgi:hypothetical protein